MGIQESCVYFAARGLTRSGVIMTNAFLLFLVQAPLLVVFGYALIPTFIKGQSPEVIAASRLLLTTTVMGLFALYGSSLLRGRLQMSAYNGLQLIVPVGSLIGIVALSLSQRLGLRELTVLYVGLYIILAATAVIILISAKAWDILQSSGPIMRKMVVYGAKVQVGSLSQIANLRLDQLLMAALLPPAQLGLYVVAVSVTNLVGVLPFATRLVVTSRVARANGSHEHRDGLEDKLRLYWTLNVISGVLLLVLAPPAIALLFGPAFIPAILAAEILIVGAVFVGGKEILTGPAYGLGTPTLVSQGEILSLGVTAVGLAVLLPAWGIVGASVTSLLSYAVAFSFLAFRMRAVHGISLRKVLAIGPRDLVAALQLAKKFTSGIAYARGEK
jgi:O-antigen/teichoic acid export membrane protein